MVKRRRLCRSMSWRRRRRSGPPAAPPLSCSRLQAVADKVVKPLLFVDDHESTSPPLTSPDAQETEDRLRRRSTCITELGAHFTRDHSTQQRPWRRPSSVRRTPHSTRWEWKSLKRDQLLRFHC